MTSDRAGAHKKRILFVVEGEKTEPSLIRGMFEAFGLGDTREVVSVGTNIHEFLRFLIQTYGEDIESVELRDALREFLGEGAPASLCGGRHFTDTVLVFDLDPQDNRLDWDALQNLQETLCDSTDIGMLYINYPSVEALRDFSAFGDEDFLDESVPLDEVSHGHAYKSRVGKRIHNGVGDVTKISGPKYAALIAMHASKVQHLVYGASKGDASYWACGGALSREVSQLEMPPLLEFENKVLADEGVVYPCCTFPFFVSAWPSHLDGAWKKWQISGPI